jgi:hypothetical protein
MIGIGWRAVLGDMLLDALLGTPSSSSSLRSIGGRLFDNVVRTWLLLPGYVPSPTLTMEYERKSEVQLRIRTASAHRFYHIDDTFTDDTSKNHLAVN